MFQPTGGELVETIERRLLRAMLTGVVAQHITCHISGEVLDRKSAVSVKLTGPKSGVTRSAVYCATVFDRDISPKLPAIREKGFTVEVIDGRELW